MPVIQITKDNSPTLLHTSLGVTYHSIFGAKGESEYVFIHQSELETKLSTQNKVHIVEVGLGTGLNAWLTRNLAQKYPNTHVVYTSFEIFPLPVEILSEFYQILGEVSFAEVIGAFPKNICIDNFQTDFHYLSWLDVNLPENIADVVFYDAFAPKTCPELWTEEAMKKVIHVLKPGGVMTTFSVTGEVKRILKNMPVTVLTPKGFGAKREMLKVLKNKL